MKVSSVFLNNIQVAAREDAVVVKYHTLYTVTVNTPPGEENKLTPASSRVKASGTGRLLMHQQWETLSAGRIEEKWWTLFKIQNI